MTEEEIVAKLRIISNKYTRKYPSETIIGLIKKMSDEDKEFIDNNLHAFYREFAEVI